MSVLRMSVLIIGLATTAQAAGPTLDHLFPAGARRGQTVEVRLGGQFSKWPVRTWVDLPGVTLEAAPEKGKLIAKVDAQAVPGLRLIRVVDDQGASAPRPFLIGTVPEQLEREPNDELRQAQTVDTLPVVMNGRLGKRGDVDVFGVTLRRGQKLVAAVEGIHRLGSPMDAVIQVASADGIVRQQVDDSPGLDPTAVFDPPVDGRYLVRVFAFPETPDSTIAFAGGESYIYRVTLTTSGYLEQVSPMIATAGVKTGFEAIGWNLPAALGPLRADATDGRLRVWHPDLAGDLTVPVVDLPGHRERDAGPLAVPFAFSGRISRAEEVDRIPVSLKKGKGYRFRVAAQAVGSPLDPVIKIHDAAGKLVAEQDDSTGRDVELNFTAPADGVFEVAIGDLNGAGSALHVYALTVTEPTADFALEAAEDRLTLTPGKSATLALKVARRDGFDRPIAIECPNLPAGVKLRPTASEPKGATAEALTLTFEAAPGTKPFSGPLQLHGRSGDRSRPVIWPVPKLDKVSLDRLWLTVLPAPK